VGEPTPPSSPLTTCLVALRRRAGLLALIAAVIAVIALAWLIVFQPERTATSSTIDFKNPANEETAAKLPRGLLPTVVAASELSAVVARTDRTVLERNHVTVEAENSSVRVSASVDDPEDDVVPQIIASYRAEQQAEYATRLGAAIAARQRSLESLDAEAATLDDSAAAAGDVAREAIVVRQVAIAADRQELVDEIGALEAYAATSPDAVERIVAAQPDSTGDLTDDLQRAALVLLTVLILGAIIVAAASLLRAFSDDS
jgi:hypothetical protein